MPSFAEKIAAISAGQYKEENKKKNPKTKPKSLKTTVNSFSSANMEQYVYIHDEEYAWLPAKIIQQSSDPNEDDEVVVNVALPPHWHRSTVLHADSTIEEAEDGLLELTPAEQSYYNTEDSYHAGRNAKLESLPTVQRTVYLGDYPYRELPLINRAPNVRDMADLAFLHEPGILYNLKQRHFQGQPYTRVGDIVVAMNPFTWMDHLYSSKTRDFYAKTILWNEDENTTEEEEKEEETNIEENGGEEDKRKELLRSSSVVNTFESMYERLGMDPHVYEVSCLAYRGLASDRQNQTILVSGESGAGKTETVKIVISHLATLQQSRPRHMCGSDTFHENGSADMTVRRVLESSPVFEAFGNAKTLRNDNSSRFGKFTQLQFRVEQAEEAARQGRSIPLCQLAGSFCVTYLLEKSRVVSHSMGERNYHIFYQLMAAPDEYKKQLWEPLQHMTGESFRYLGATEIDSIDGVPDEKQWPRTLEALKVFELEGDSLHTLMRALCVVLQLGNLTFDRDPGAGIEEGGTVITSIEELEILSDLIGIDPNVIESEMTLRLIKTGYDEVHVQLSPSVAKESCDALAKEIYNRIFDVLVRKVNAYTRADGEDSHEKFGMISLLDIFGFERFQVNRFEQLCINYANEQLQHKYVLDNFRKVQEEYEAEGIDIFDFAIVDNSDILKLLQGRMGLIVSLNEECVRPKGNDESFVYKIKVVQKAHDRFIDKKLHRKTEFGIKHFAGPVTYDATKFVERNMDKLPDGLMYCAATSTNSLIRDEFATLVAAHEAATSSGVRRKKATNRTVLEKFRSQLKDLMASMENTSTRYIRCIKPNETMTPRQTQHDTTMRQLECAGLVTAIAISRESFPNKLQYDAIMERFECLMTKQDLEYMATVDKKDATNYILCNLLVTMAEKRRNGSLIMPFQCGNTKVYFRSGALEHLETKRLDYYTRRVVLIQRWVRKMQAEEKYAETRAKIIKIQTMARCRIEWKRYNQQKQAAIVLACWARRCGAMALLQFMREYRAATTVQSRWRTVSKASQLRRFKEAAVVIQKAVRNRRKKTDFSAKLAIAVEEAKMDHRLLGLKHQVSVRGDRIPSDSANKVTGRRVDENMLEEIETMFDYLRKEIFMLRGKNTELKAELREAEDDKREILIHAESSEAAASSSRLQVAALTKSNAVLSKEILEHRHEAALLKKELKNTNTYHEEAVMAIKSNHENTNKQLAAEVSDLQMSLREVKRQKHQEKKHLREEMAKLEEAHAADIARMKANLRQTQESHHDYLAKLMEVLETTHEQREVETARISAELNAVKEEKDMQIIQLQREVETLKSLQTNGVAPETHGTDEAMELEALRRLLAQNVAARDARARKFRQVSDTLGATVFPNNPAVLASRRKMSRNSSISMTEEDAQNAKKMIGYLEELYEQEEKTQAKMSEQLMLRLEAFATAPEPGEVVEDLKARLASVEEENETLNEQLLALAHCARCEARDRRKARHSSTSSRNLKKQGSSRFNA